MADDKTTKPGPNVRGWNPKQVPNIPTKTGRASVSLKTEQFDALIDRQGVRVKVYRTSYCPNVKSIDGAEHEMDCPVCNGSGFVDRYCIDTWTFIQNQQLEKQANPEGIYDGNTVTATFQQGIELQYFTLVELQDFTEAFFERIKRQTGRVDVLKYRGIRINLLIDQNGNEYFEGSHFNLDGNGNIFWCSGKDPRPGTIYSINYETAVRFRAIKSHHSNRFVQTTRNGETKLIKMNEQWVLQKEYLVVRKALNGEVIPPNKIRDSDDTSEPLPSLDLNAPDVNEDY